MTPGLIIEISHLYAIYARALDEKRYDLLTQVFTPDAVLHYAVGSHEFSCTGAAASSSFDRFLSLCYWTNHVIAQPMVEVSDGGVRACARVVATHLQRLPEGTLTRWVVRGSYHDALNSSPGGWRVARRHCICPDTEGVFRDQGVESFPTVAWASSALLN